MFKPNDYVAYSADFCASIGAFAGDIPHLRGHVLEVQQMRHGKHQLVRVQWIDGVQMNVLSCNLAHVGPNSRFCRC